VEKTVSTQRTHRRPAIALPWGVAVMAGLLGLSGLGTISQLLSEHAAQDPALSSVPLDVERHTLPELIVDLDDRVSDRQVQDLAGRYDAKFTPASAYYTQDRVYRVQVEGPSVRARLSNILTALRRDAQVEAADYALLYHIPETAPGALTQAGEQGLSLSRAGSPAPLRETPRFLPNDPKYRYQWHLDQIHMPEAWTKNQGEGVVVAVLDTGVTPVEDLAGTELVPGWNFADNNADTHDDHGHGTHVAGTIAQTTHNELGVAGVAYRAKIMPIKVLSGSGSGSVAGIAEGIRWAADHGARVINMSLGGPFYSQVLAKAVRYAADRGVVVVCAAGNDGRGKVSYPAANSGALAVAATQFDETTTFYSNWGKEVFVAAPGGNTRLDQNNDGVPDGVLQNTVTPGNIDKHDYLLFMGTSMASPHVAGVAALLLSAGARDPAEVKRLIEQTAHRPAAYRGKHDPHYGAGIVDASAALDALTEAQRSQAATPVRSGAGLMMGLLGLSLAIALSLYLTRQLALLAKPHA
jgi:serine protease